MLKYLQVNGHDVWNSRCYKAKEKEGASGGNMVDKLLPAEAG